VSFEKKKRVLRSNFPVLIISKTYSRDPIHANDGQAQDKDKRYTSDEPDVVSAVFQRRNDPVKARPVLGEHVQQGVAKSDDVHGD
jgi:hypothetical protein